VALQDGRGPPVEIVNLLIDRRGGAVFERNKLEARPDANRLEHDGSAHTQEPDGRRRLRERLGLPF
jgi:hypothetical protein